MNRGWVGWTGEKVNSREEEVAVEMRIVQGVEGAYRE